METGIGRGLLDIKPGLDLYVHSFVESGIIYVSQFLQKFNNPTAAYNWLVKDLAIVPDDAYRISKGLFRKFSHKVFGGDTDHINGPSDAFIEASKPLLDEAMGTENMAPLLYSLVRFCKPKRILEVGAGYTSVFLCQALRDNLIELKRGVYKPRDASKGTVPWNIDQVEDILEEEYLGKHTELSCVDNLAHAHTTAHLVKELVQQLGIERHIKIIEQDVWAEGFADSFEDGELDLLWADFGVSTRLDEFFGTFWEKVSAEGGMLIIHSSLTNAMTRKWIEGKKQLVGEGKADFEIMSFLEPHKQLQNSFTILRKRANGYEEPIYSTYP